MANTIAALPSSLPPPHTGVCDLLIIAGEHSGDQHAARMVSQLNHAMPELNICALGGKELNSAGTQLLFDLTEYSVVGLAEVIKNYRFFKTLFNQVIDWITEYQPKAVCFIDYPGFNLMLAEKIHKLGLAKKAGGPITLLYYISPQVWAWKAKRRFKMAKLLDSLAVIFPFETAIFEDTDLPVKFVGHPFVDAEYNNHVQYRENAPLLLLPGSRNQAVSRIFPLLLKGFQSYLNKAPDETAQVICPDANIQNVVEQILESYPASFKDRINIFPAGEQLSAKAVLTSSGTMSLNCALAGIPGGIVYKANIFTYIVGRALVKIPYLGIANILLKNPAWPEYIQGAANPNVLAKELHSACTVTARRQMAADNARKLKNILSAAADTTAGAWLMQNLD